MTDFSSLSTVEQLREFAFYDIKGQKPQKKSQPPIITNKSIEKVYLWYFKSVVRKEVEQLLTENGRLNGYINYSNDLDLGYEE